MSSVEHAPSSQTDLEPEWMPEVKPVKLQAFEKEKYARLEAGAAYKNAFEQGVGLGLSEAVAHERALDAEQEYKKTLYKQEFEQAVGLGLSEADANERALDALERGPILTKKALNKNERDNKDKELLERKLDSDKIH